MSRWRRLGVLVRSPDGLMLAACLAIALMYALNHDMGGDPVSPRGDGVYRPVLARGDGHMLYLIARSTALDLDWNFDNDLRRFGDPWNEPRTSTGRKAIIHPIGAPLVWTPLIWIAQGGAVVANLLGAGIQLHGYTLWHQRFVFFSSVLFACGAVLFGRRVALHAIGGRWGPTYAAVAILLGTSLTYYATFMPSYSHAIDAFACSAFLAYWALTIGREDRKRWLVLGLLLGLAALVRTQELAMGIVIAIEVIVESVRTPQRALRWLLGGGLVLGVAAVMLVPQLVEWHVVFGKVTELPQGKKYTRLEAPMIGELLYSARNGWFTTTPVAYAGVFGLVFCMPRSARVIAAGLIAVVGVQVYLNSTILDWWGSAAFGQRRMCNVTLPLVVGLAALIWRCNRLAARRPQIPRVVWHVLLVAGLGGFVAWNLAAVGKLRGGRGAPSELSPSCCNNLPRALRPLASSVYQRIGNPFEFPANAIFGLRHRVPLTRWDQMFGAYPLQPSLASLHDERFYDARGKWSPIDPAYLVGGWSEPQNDGPRRYRVTTDTDATLLVPNLMPDGQRLTLWVRGAGYVQVTWNGDVVAHGLVVPGTWTAMTFDVAAIALHTNELAVLPVGIAVSDLELSLLR